MHCGDGDLDMKTVHVCYTIGCVGINKEDDFLYLYGVAGWI
jgi:hypothetical protein